MFDPEKLMGQMLGGSLSDAFGGSRGRRKRTSMFGSLGTAGKAQLGLGLLGIAMAAWEHYGQQNRTGTVPAHPPMPASPAPSPAMRPPPPPPASPPPPPAAVKTRTLPVLDDRQQHVVLLIRTMIAAANADGHIDAAERDALLARARDGGLNEETLSWLDAEIARPQTLGQVISNGRPELSAELYAAAALAITVDTQAERQWLDALAHGLHLDPAVRADLDARIAAA